MNEMIILYDRAPDQMPVYTVQNGYIPRIDWLMQERAYLRSKGRKVKLKRKSGESWLLVDNKYKLDRTDTPC
jgi:hypothetical protein